MTARFMVALLCLLALSACGVPATGTAVVRSSNGAIAVSDAWARPMEGAGAMDHSDMQAMSGVSSTAYMTIRNTGPADRLIKATTDAAMTVELHDNSNTNGVISMSQVQTVDIPANGTIEFKPTGLHMMLIGLKHDLNVGDTVALSLQFEKAGTVKVNAMVRDQ